jgi:chitin synthase
MLAAIYGLQALVFVFRRKWDMIGWMLFYIFAIPVFSFYVPLYAFWRMDDFSWGQTRIVMGEKGKKLVVHVRDISLVRLLPVITLLSRRRANLTPASYP